MKIPIIPASGSSPGMVPGCWWGTGTPVCSGGAIWMGSTPECSCTSNAGITMSNGVLDNNYNQVLSNSYGNIYYINEDKFIVGTNQSDPALEEILILDGNENVIKKTNGFLCADSDSTFYCAEGHIKFCDTTSGDTWGEGVMDQDLNVIIEPIYYDIYFLDGYYKVDDADFNELHLDINGNPR